MAKCIPDRIPLPLITFCTKDEYDMIFGKWGSQKLFVLDVCVNCLFVFYYVKDTVTFFSSSGAALGKN